MFEKIKQWLFDAVYVKRGYIWDTPLRVYFDGLINVEERKLLTQDENGNMTIHSGTWQVGSGYIYFPLCADNGQRLALNGFEVE